MLLLHESRPSHHCLVFFTSTASWQKNNKTFLLAEEGSERLKPLKSPAFTWSYMPSQKSVFYFHKSQEVLKSTIEAYTKPASLACRLLWNRLTTKCHCLIKLKRMDGLGNRHDSNSHQLPEQIKLCHWGNFSAFATNRNSKVLRDLIWHNSWQETHGVIGHEKNCTEVNCFLRSPEDSP